MVQTSLEGSCLRGDVVGDEVVPEGLPEGRDREALLRVDMNKATRNQPPHKSFVRNDLCGVERTDLRPVLLIVGVSVGTGRRTPVLALADVEVLEQAELAAVNDAEDALIPKNRPLVDELD